MFVRLQFQLASGKKRSPGALQIGPAKTSRKREAWLALSQERLESASALAHPDGCLLLLPLASPKPLVEILLPSSVEYLPLLNSQGTLSEHFFSQYKGSVEINQSLRHCTRTFAHFHSIQQENISLSYIQFKVFTLKTAARCNS